MIFVVSSTRVKLSIIMNLKNSSAVNLLKSLAKKFNKNSFCIVLSIFLKATSSG